MALDLQINERVLCQLWHGQAWRRRALRTRSGRSVQVVFRGRWSGGHGPDFTDALLTFDDGPLQRGDVEIHLRASDWEGHGHARDRTYNCTLLHVVQVDDRAAACRRADGTPVEVLVVGPELPDLLAMSRPLGVAGVLDHPTVERCTINARAAAGELWRRLGELGDERLQGRAARLEGDLEVVPPDEIVYRGVMEALGYQHNREAMRALAGRVPYHLVEALALSRRGSERVQALEVLLLGAGGFLEDMGVEGPAGRCWQQWRERYHLEPLDPGCWRRCRVRPANAPDRRLRGLARWLADVVAEGPAAAVERAVRSGPEPLRRLARVPSEAAGAPALVGAGRAAEIAVNVALPFALAWAGRTDDAELAGLARAAYRQLSPSPENRVTRLVRAQIFGVDAARHRHGAREQQGMLQLHHTHCLDMQCLDCPLGGGLAVVREGGRTCPGR